MLSDRNISHSDHHRVHAPGSVKKTAGNPVCSDTDLAPGLYGSHLMRTSTPHSTFVNLYYYQGLPKWK